MFKNQVQAENMHKARDNKALIKPWQTTLRANFDVKI